VEEGGCGFRLKETRIYVELQLQRNPSSRRVVNTGRWILEISVDDERFSEWFSSCLKCMENKRTVRLTCTSKCTREVAQM
jgi:hypothetical protein